MPQAGQSVFIEGGKSKPGAVKPGGGEKSGRGCCHMRFPFTLEMMAAECLKDTVE